MVLSNATSQLAALRVAICWVESTFNNLSLCVTFDNRFAKNCTISAKSGNYAHDVCCQLVPCQCWQFWLENRGEPNHSHAVALLAQKATGKFPQAGNLNHVSIGAGPIRLVQVAPSQRLWSATFRAAFFIAQRLDHPESPEMAVPRIKPLNISTSSNYE